jgi:hypothetical protein
MAPSAAILANAHPLQNACIMLYMLLMHNILLMLYMPVDMPRGVMPDTDTCLWVSL